MPSSAKEYITAVCFAAAQLVNVRLRFTPPCTAPDTQEDFGLRHLKAFLRATTFAQGSSARTDEADAKLLLVSTWVARVAPCCRVSAIIHRGAEQVHARWDLYKWRGAKRFLKINVLRATLSFLYATSTSCCEKLNSQSQSQKSKVKSQSQRPVSSILVRSLLSLVERAKAHHNIAFAPTPRALLVLRAFHWCFYRSQTIRGNYIQMSLFCRRAGHTCCS